MFSFIRKRLIDILGIGNILVIDIDIDQNVRSYKTCRNVKLNKFFFYVYDLIVQLKRGSFWNVTMWSIWSIHHQIWTDFATVDEIWNSVEKSEFAPIVKIDISRFLLLSSDLFESGSEIGRNIFSNFEQFRDLTLCESGSPTMVWRRASRTKALHWARVSRYTQAAATVNADTARRYTFVTYIRDTTTRYKTKIYPLNILPKSRAQLPVWLFASCIWQFIVSLGNAAATSSTTSLTILNDFMSVYGFQFFYFIFPIFQFCISSISVPQCESPTITLEPTFSCFPVSLFPCFSCFEPIFSCFFTGAAASLSTSFSSIPRKGLGQKGCRMW